MTGIKHVVGCAVAFAVASTGVAVAQGSRATYGLTGTYQLDRAQSENPQRAAQLASRGVPPNQRQRTYESLLARLESPEQIAFERNGRQVTMASTRAPRVSFDADGIDRSERWSDEQTMNTRVTLAGDRLVVVTRGNRGSDFTVTFDVMNNGRRLQMTRTIDDERLREPVTVRSIYRRLSNDARWDIDYGGGTGPGYGRGSADGVGVPDGLRLAVILETPLTTWNARDRDLCTMTVQSPPQFRGAVITGFASTMRDSDRRAGRMGLTLNFETIRLRNGRSYPFDGSILDVRAPGGDAFGVNRDGTADSRGNQTDRIIERSVIGAALGAMIGAVAGGGKGAAIGAAIGAGSGAGTVFIEGRDRLDLPRGSEITIVSGNPRR